MIVDDYNQVRFGAIRLDTIEGVQGRIPAGPHWDNDRALHFIDLRQLQVPLILTVESYSSIRCLYSRQAEGHLGWSALGMHEMISRAKDFATETGLLQQAAERINCLRAFSMSPAPNRSFA